MAGRGHSWVLAVREAKVAIEARALGSRGTVAAKDKSGQC